uniref:Lymphocyte antigen 6 family member L n=1 Tax=Molossus molossus TaxID=27622 RepID=A0A7J8BAV1_MOLMO|nr:lymphocyte antigen 6 family member L [Molossus molossus]
MEGWVLVLWALLLGQGTVLVPHGPEAALQGFAGGKAQTVTKAEQCTPTVCSSGDQVCVSHTVMFLLGSGVYVLLSKRCAPWCPNTNMIHEWPSPHKVLRRIVRQCCARSLCNAAPPTLGVPWALLAVLMFPWGLSLLGALL